MATAYLEGKFESTPGNETNTPTLSTKQIYIPLQSFEVNLNPTPLDRNDELRGVDEPISFLPDVYDPTWSMTTRAYPDPLGFVLKNALGDPTTTAGNGVITDPDSGTIPTGASRHVWTAPFGPSGNYPQTAQYQASYKDQSTAYKLKGSAVNSIEIANPDTGGVQLSVSGNSLYQSRISEPALTPSYESLTTAPFLKSFLTQSSWLASSGTATDVSLRCEVPTEPTHTLGTASRFADAMFKGDGPIKFTGSVTLRNITTADFDALLANTGFAVKLRWRSTVVIGATAYFYTLWFQALNAQYTGGGPEALGNKRIHGATFDWAATYTGSAGSTTVTLVNATTSYA